jgi:hypothetical protein
VGIKNKLVDGLPDDPVTMKKIETFCRDIASAPITRRQRCHAKMVGPALNLEKPARIPHTEMSAERYHWSLVSAVTGVSNR